MQRDTLPWDSAVDSIEITFSTTEHLVRKRTKIFKAGFILCGVRQVHFVSIASLYTNAHHLPFISWDRGIVHLRTTLDSVRTEAKADVCNTRDDFLKLATHAYVAVLKDSADKLRTTSWLPPPTETRGFFTRDRPTFCTCCLGSCLFEPHGTAVDGG